MTTTEAIITKILDCGTADLSLLDDIHYDLDDIIDELMHNNCLSLHSIFEEVFKMGAKELQEKFDERKYDIEQQILEALEEEKEECILSGEMTEEELEECEEHQDLISDLNLLRSGILQPEEDVSYYLNCLDTHVFLKRIDFYRKYMEHDVDCIEYDMGFNFKHID